MSAIPGRVWLLRHQRGVAGAFYPCFLRIAFSTIKIEWMQTHNTSVFDEFDETNLAPSYNVAPQSFQPIVRLNRDTGQRELAVVR